MPRVHPNIHLLRTFIVNGVNAGVALGLYLNKRRNRELEPLPWPPGVPAPFVEIIIPARNEERNIGPLLQSLLAQSYPSNRFRITVVDDASSDRTPAIAAEVATSHHQVRLIAAPPLPTGWTGKNHAMYTGFLATRSDARFLLFVDADTRHAPHALSTVVRRAQETGAHLLSLIIGVDMASFWERVIVPQMGEFYTLLVGTMDSVNREGGAAAANGQFLLITRDLYAKVGSLHAVRGDVAEDRAIAAAAKQSGHKIRLDYGRLLAHARVYSSLREMWAGYSKTLFWATGHNAVRSFAIALALALYALLPPVTFLYALINRRSPDRKSALLNGLFQLLPTFALRAVICRMFGLPPIYALSYPLAVAAGDAMLIFSVYRVLSGKGVQWKGRTYTQYKDE